VRERASFDVDPPRKLVRAAEVKTVEERTTVQRRGARIVASRNGGRELEDVDRNERRIESQILCTPDHAFDTEVLSQGVYGLGECARSAFIVRIRPEKREDSLAADTAIASAGKQREDRQPPRLD